ncbi:TPA: hypothetical protein ACTYRL_000558 [Klebsiella michiganensis]
MAKSTITREQITSWMNDANYALEEPLNADDAAAARAILAMGHELLAAMDQKPALHRYRRKAVEPYGPYPWHYEVFVDYPRPVECIEDEYFYAAPPVVTGFAVDGEPVAWLLSGGGAKNVVCFDSGNAYADPLREVTPLYRHAQPAPVVPDDVLKALQKVARIRLDMDGFDGDRRGIADCLCDAEEALIEVVNCCAAMLHAGNSPAQSDCCPAQNCIHPAQIADRPVAWHHTAKSKEENHSTCCFSYAPSHDFGPWYEKPQSQPHYLPEELDYDRALHFLSTEPRKATPETVIGGNYPAIPGCDGAELLPSTGVVIELNPANNKLYTPLSTGISITREMIIAGQEELEACIDNGFDSDADGNRHDYTAIASDAPYRVFCAMLAAAPQEVKGE